MMSRLRLGAFVWRGRSSSMGRPREVGTEAWRNGASLPFCGPRPAPATRSACSFRETRMTLPERMRAIDGSSFGGPEVLRLVEMPTPKPGPDEVLVRVAAAGVNRPDVLQRKGHYPPPPGVSAVPGLEIAGEIVALGERVKDLAIGSKVCALVAGGGYAQYCPVPAVQCLPWPKGF